MCVHHHVTDGGGGAAGGHVPVRSLQVSVQGVWLLVWSVLVDEHCSTTCPAVLLL